MPEEVERAMMPQHDNFYDTYSKAKKLKIKWPHGARMGDWKPLKTEQIKDDSSWDHTLYLWHVEAGKK